MEKDDDLKGEGNSYDFGARMLDPRLGRWLTIDPQTSKQPSFSPYKAFLNSPIIFNDPDGEDEFLTTIYKDANGNITKRVVSDKAISTKVRAGNLGYIKGGGRHYRNYYDFRTVVTITTGADGTTTEEITHYTLTKFQRAKSMPGGKWLPNAKVGDIVEARLVVEEYERPEQVNGIIIYGSASSSKDSPGTKKNIGKIWGSFDFSEFNETMGLIITAVSNKDDNTLDGEFDGTKAAEMADKAKEIAEYDEDATPVKKAKKLVRTDSSEVNVYQGGFIKKPGLYTYKQSNKSIEAGEIPNEKNSRLIQGP